MEDQRPAKIQNGARMNLLVNSVRGLMLALVIMGHWLPTLVRRLPELSFWQAPLNVVFNLATPGFALLFGLAMGKVYYPRYLVNADQTRRMLLAGAWMLLTGLLIVFISMIVGGQVPATLILRGILLFNVLTYYVLALASAPIWFRVISHFKSDYAGCAVLMIAFYAAYQSLSLWSGPYDQYEGSIGLGLLVGKFNYFNMSFGVIGGCAAGIYLERHGDERLPLLARRFSVLGIVSVSLGLLILLLRSGSLQSLGADDTDMGLWRWVFYSGLVLVLGGPLAAAMVHLERWPPNLRRGVEVIAIVGQCTFPIFVMHVVVWFLKPVLIGLGIPDPVALALLLATFICFSAWCINSVYQLHYGDLYRKT
jgi:hypothetical protein